MAEMTLAERASEVRSVNETNGWFDESRTMGDDLALLHSEVSEMLEAFRVRGVESYTAPIKHNGDCPNATTRYRYGHRAENCGECGAIGKPDDFGSEAADVLIRLLDTCSRYDIDLDLEYIRKIRYNRTRGYKHGGKGL